MRNRYRDKMSLIGSGRKERKNSSMKKWNGLKIIEEWSGDLYQLKKF
jgi:hypothetical protein